MDVDDALGQQQLEALAVVSDGPLPVFGRLPARHELELVGRQEVALEQDAGAFAALTQLVEKHGGFVLAALHLQNGLAVLVDQLHHVVRAARVGRPFHGG